MLKAAVVLCVVALSQREALACQELQVGEFNWYRDWSFHTGSPLSGAPVSSLDGRVYVAANEGYIHALSSDGGFLWSYTVAGGLASPLQLDESGRVYAASAIGYLYALNPSGAPHWVFQLPVEPATPLSYSSRKLLYFASSGFFYGVSARRGVLWNAYLSSPVVAGPLSDAQGRAWLITRDGTLHIFSKPALRIERRLPPATQYRLSSVSNEGAAIIADSTLLQVNGEGVVRFEASGFEFATLVDDTLVGIRNHKAEAPFGLESSELVVMKAGYPEPPIRLGFKAAAAPAVEGDIVVVSGERGEFAVVSGDRFSTCQVSSSPLLTPVIDSERRILVAAGDGAVFGFTVDVDTALTR
jgi:hypothetical protein